MPYQRPTPRVLLIGLAAGAILLLFFLHPWDKDADGSWAMLWAPYDCDDTDARLFPGNPEIALNGVDEDCDGRDAFDGANVVIVLIDALRPDRLGCYGYGKATSPTIDAIAAQGITFENTYSQAAWTGASVATLFTSVYPSSHGLSTFRYGKEKMSTDLLPEGFITLAENLKETGYRTLGVTSNDWTGPLMQFDQGFDRYLLVRADAQVTAETTKWIREQDREAPFFVYAHYMTIHMPYTPPPEYRAQFPPDAGLERTIKDVIRKGCVTPGEPTPDCVYQGHLYDAGIRYLDDNVKTILDALRATGQGERTILIIMADHGEEFCEHVYCCAHGHQLYQEVVRVPFIMRLPGAVRAGARVSQNMRLIDVKPTLLDLLGINASEEIQGASRINAIFGVDEENPDVYSESIYPGEGPEQKSLISGDLKLIYHTTRKTYRLFDLSQDPLERENLYDESHEQSQRMKRKLDFNVREARKVKRGKKTIELDSATIERLKELGYVD